MLKVLILILLLNSIKSENSPNKSDLDSIMAVFGPKKKQAPEEINSSVSMVSDSDDAEGQVGKASDDIKTERKASSYLKESKMMSFEDSDYNKTKGGYDSGSDAILESALKKGKKRHFNGDSRKDGYKRKKFKEDISESNLDSSERLKICKKTNEKLRKRLKKYESQSSSKRSKNSNFKKYNEKRSKIHKISEDENKSDVFDRISSDSLDNSDPGSQKKNKTQHNKRFPKSKDRKKFKSHDGDSEISGFEHSMKG